MSCEQVRDGDDAAGQGDEEMQQICLTHDPDRERRETRHNSIYWQRYTPLSEDAYRDRNIKSVLSVLGEDEPGPISSDGVTCWRSPPVEDCLDQVSLNALAESLTEVHARIDDALAAGFSVLLHCSGNGIRSSTALVSYTMKRIGIGRVEALRRLSACAHLAEIPSGCWDLLGEKETEYLASWTEDFLPTFDPMEPPGRQQLSVCRSEGWDLQDNQDRESFGGLDDLDKHDSASEASEISGGQFKPVA